MITVHSDDNDYGTIYVPDHDTQIKRITTMDLWKLKKAIKKFFAKGDIVEIALYPQKEGQDALLMRNVNDTRNVWLVVCSVIVEEEKE